MIDGELLADDNLGVKQFTIGDEVHFYNQVWPKDTPDGADWNWCQTYIVEGINGHILRITRSYSDNNIYTQKSLSCHYKQCRIVKVTS